MVKYLFVIVSPYNMILCVWPIWPSNIVDNIFAIVIANLVYIYSDKKAIKVKKLNQQSQSVQCKDWIKAFIGLAQSQNHEYKNKSKM